MIKLLFALFLSGLVIAGEYPKAPTEWENTISRTAVQGLLKKCPEIRGPGITKLSENSLNLLQANLERSRLGWKIHALNGNSTVNACALPNGNLYLYSGLLQKLQNDLWISVIAHEVAHAEFAHSARMENQRVIRSNIAQALSVLITAAAFTGGLAVGLVLNPAEFYLFTQKISDEVVLASLFDYSQSLELEADRKGFNLLSECGLEPAQFILALNQIDLLEREIYIRKPHYIDHPWASTRINALLVRYSRRDDAFAFMKDQWMPLPEASEWVYLQNERINELPVLRDCRTCYTSTISVTGKVGYYQPEEIYRGYDLPSYFTSFAETFHEKVIEQIPAKFITTPQELRPGKREQFAIFRQHLIAIKCNNLNDEFLKHFQDVFRQKTYNSFKSWADRHGYQYIGPYNRLMDNDAVDITAELRAELKWIQDKTDRFTMPTAPITQ